MSIGSLIDDRFTAVASSLATTTNKVAEFLQELSNINRNIDGISINVGMRKVQGPTGIDRNVLDTPLDESDALKIASPDHVTIDAPTLPDMSDYLGILTTIKNLAFSPYDKYNPTTLRDIDFTVGSPDLLNSIPIKTAPGDISISDLVTYSFDTIMIPEATLILPDLDINDIDPLNDTIEDYMDFDLNSLINNLLNMLNTLIGFLNSVSGDNSLNEWLQKIEDRHLAQADSWTESQLATDLDTVPFTSFEKTNPMPTHAVANSMKNNIVAELYGKSRAEIFEFIENEKDKTELLQYEALLSIHKSFFDSYLSLLKHQYKLANGVWELAILKYKASLDIRKFEISVHEAMIATIEEYLEAYQDGQRAYQSQLSYNKAFVELSNAALTKIQNEVGLYRTRVELYKARVSEIDSQIKLSSAKVRAFENQIAEKLAYVKENTVKYQANQNFISLIADELEANKTVMDSERLAAEIELLRDTMNNDNISYMLANISSDRNKALTRVKMEAQQADLQTLRIENAFKKLQAIKERYYSRIEQMKSQYALNANRWGYNEASSGIRTNVRTVQEIIDSISQIALTGYEPLAALAAGMANTVDAMVSGVYEGITNL